MKLIYLVDLQKYIDTQSKYPRPLNMDTALKKLVEHGLTASEAHRYLATIKNSNTTYNEIYLKPQPISKGTVYMGRGMFSVQGKKRKASMVLSDMMAEGTQLKEALIVMQKMVDESGRQD